MKYLSVKEIAALWNTSERSVRNYCAAGRVPGAFLTGKTWNIPENAEKPERSNKSKPHRRLCRIFLKRKSAVRLTAEFIIRCRWNSPTTPITWRAAA